MQTRRQLPNNVAELQALLSAQFVAFDALANEHNAVKVERDDIKVERDALKKAKFDDQEEIKRLTLLIAKLKRMAFGQKSEKLRTQIDQLVLELEEMHIA
jgi:transposase